MEANYEVREPDPLADPSSAWGQRQIILRHGMYRMVRTTRECLMPFFRKYSSASWPNTFER